LWNLKMLLDIPQSGKRGLTVSQGGRNGQISRALVIPSNPRTDAQMRVRNFLANVASQWSALSQAQRDAWTTAGKQHQSKSRLGRSGPLSGFQLYSKINCSLLNIGLPAVSVPPAAPAFALLPVTGLTITNASGVVSLKLTTTDAPADGTMLRAAPPCSQGRNVSPDTVYLGQLDSPQNGAVDITAAYTAKYGTPPAGKKVFVQVNQNVGGWEDIPRQFWAIVPASA
jgi:hypothetical protein